MKNLPLIPKFLLNVVLFWVYFVVGSVIGAVIYWLLWMVAGMNMPAANDPIFDKIWIGVLVLTFIITLVFRKYFYMPLSLEDEKEHDTKHHKKKKMNFSME